MSEKIPSNVLTFKPRTGQKRIEDTTDVPNNETYDKLSAAMMNYISGVPMDETGHWLHSSCILSLNDLQPDQVRIVAQDDVAEKLFRSGAWIVYRVLGQVHWTQSFWRNSLRVVSNSANEETEPGIVIPTVVFHIGSGAALSVRAHHFGEDPAPEVIMARSISNRGSDAVWDISRNPEALVDEWSLEPDLIHDALMEFRRAALVCESGWVVEDGEQLLRFSFNHVCVGKNIIQEFIFSLTKEYVATFETDVVL